MEEQNATPIVVEPVKEKKLKYEDLSLTETIVFQVTVQTTVEEDGAPELKDTRELRSATKAYWENLEEYPKGHSKSSKKKDISAQVREPLLVGYIRGGALVKF